MMTAEELLEIVQASVDTGQDMGVYIREMMALPVLAHGAAGSELVAEDPEWRVWLLRDQLATLEQPDGSYSGGPSGQPWGFAEHLSGGWWETVATMRFTEPGEVPA